MMFVFYCGPAQITTERVQNEQRERDPTLINQFICPLPMHYVFVVTSSSSSSSSMVLVMTIVLMRFFLTHLLLLLLWVWFGYTAT